MAILSLAFLVPACSGSPSQPPAPVSPTARAASPAATAAAVADPAANPALRQFYAQRLTWSNCRDGFDCAKLTVPINYDDPTGGSMRLAVNRLPAVDQRHRIGSLVINPGGPGVSGIQYAEDARSEITAPVRQRYDIVGFDPRGVGESSPIRCLTDAQIDQFVALDASPDTQKEQAAWEQESRLLADSCERKAGRLLPYVGTTNAARDLDVLRAALSDAKLYFLGKSYGTFLGATYAQLFPAHVGRMVLDGAVDPSLTNEQLSLDQARGIQGAIDAYVSWCLRRPFCPLSGSTATGERRIGELLAQTDRSPLPASANRPLTQARAALGILVTLYDSARGWPALTLGLAQAFDGGGRVLGLLSDVYTDRGPNGYRSNRNEANYAINCVDRPAHSSPETIERTLPSFRSASPLFGDFLAWSNLPCNYWPVKAPDTPHRITAAGAPPIVVVGTTRDPATPYRWARALAGQLQSGILLTYIGDGHTAYARGSSCIDGTLEAYLLNGRAPSRGKRCS